MAVAAEALKAHATETILMEVAVNDARVWAPDATMGGGEEDAVAVVVQAQSMAAEPKEALVADMWDAATVAESWDEAMVAEEWDAAEVGVEVEAAAAVVAVVARVI